MIKKQSYIYSLNSYDIGTVADVLCSCHVMYMPMHTSLKLREFLKTTFPSYCCSLLFLFLR